MLADDGSLDRPALGAIVFADRGALRDLEGIVHPLVARRTAELDAPPRPTTRRRARHAAAGRDAARAPSTTSSSSWAPDAVTRVQRLVRQRGMTEAEARAASPPRPTDDERRAVADVWLDNDGDSEADLLAAVDALWDERLVPFEENVRHGIRRADGPSELELVPSDPTWPAQADAAARAASRRAVGDAGGDRSSTSGRTAVPGLLAKDVIDLQVGVARRSPTPTTRPCVASD